MTAWSLPDVVRMSGATRRQLYHWIEIGLLDPVFEEHRAGRGGAYRFDHDELRFARAVARAVHAGASVQALAAAQREGRFLGFCERLEIAARALREEAQRA